MPLRTVARPWGPYTFLEEAFGFKIKRIEVKSGASLHLQMHCHRSEHWVVVNGKAKITNGVGRSRFRRMNQPISQQGRHPLENLGIIPCVMIKVQCGSYMGEDDIIRFEDSYGRNKKL